ncbi:tol protein, partial [Apiospora sp. TS-2023a]
AAESICNSAHESCQGPKGSPRDLQLRFIDCHTYEIVEPPSSCEYVALSYVWGDAEPIKDVKDVSGKTASFPRFIEVTLGLKYRYLWVDRYCIDQDSTYKEHIINRMDQVYKHARVVIIAATGNGADDGLPGISVRRDQLLEFTMGSFTFRQMPPYGLDHLRKTKWATRGWTYQEGYLSYRRLFFSNTQTIFACDKMLFPESFTCGFELDHFGTFPSFIRGSMHSSTSYYSHLRENVEAYTSRRLTYDSDSLRAFLGVLNDYKTGVIHQLHHLWGVTILPADIHQELCIALDWVHAHGKLIRRRPGCPSWSWAGWAGKVLLPPKLKATLSIVYLDENRKTPLDTIYQTLSSSKDPPRLLYLESYVTEVMFIPGGHVKPLEDSYPPDLRPDFFAILPITDTEHMACTIYLDSAVDMMTPYPAILLEESDEVGNSNFIISNAWG